MPEFLTRRVLFQTEQVAVGECVCRAPRCGRGEEEVAFEPTFAFVRSGMFLRHVRGRQVVADSSRVHFFSKDEPYRISHPLEDGDHCVTFQPSARLLDEALAEFAPALVARGDAPLPFTDAPAEPQWLLFQARLAHRLAARATLAAIESLGIEEDVCRLTRAVISRALEARGVARRGRPATLAAHRELAEAARASLASCFRARLSLREVACAVHASPYHLCRVFRSTTGMTMQRYVNLLRARAALAQLAGGERDLTRIAVDCGFYDHSHFTHVFRREFGGPPSTWRGEGRILAPIGNRLQA